MTAPQNENKANDWFYIRCIVAYVEMDLGRTVIYGKGEKNNGTKHGLRTHERYGWAWTWDATGMNYDGSLDIAWMSYGIDVGVHRKA